jgi:CheY-like chemotaxis protein
MARVLVVEDEPNIGGIIVFKLEREGHHVHWAKDLASTAAASGFNADLVLLDSTLPDGDAIDLIAGLAARAPVVVLTEFRDLGTPARATAAGAVATIEKPFKPTQLARLVAQLWLGFGLLGLVAVILVIGGYAAVRNDPPPALYLGLHRVAAALVLAEAFFGALLYMSGRRPHVNLHLVYALAAVLVIPVARSMARRDPSKARFYHVGGTLLLLGVLFRLVSTG